MGWQADQDQDEDRLPANTERVGYDADRGVYIYRDTKNCSTWEGRPGNRYGVLHKVSSGYRTVNNTIFLRPQVTSQQRDNPKPSMLNGYVSPGPPRVGTAREIEGYNKRHSGQHMFAPLQSLGRAVSNAVTAATYTTYTALQTSVKDSRLTDRVRAMSEPSRLIRSGSRRRRSTPKWYDDESEDSEDDEKPYTRHYEFNEARSSKYGPQLFHDIKYTIDGTDEYTSSEDERHARRRQQQRTDSHRSQHLSRRRSTRN